MSQKDTLQFSVLGSRWNLTTQPILKVLTMTMETGMEPQIMGMVEAGMEHQMGGLVIVETGMDRQYLGGHCHPPLQNPQVESADKQI